MPRPARSKKTSSWDEVAVPYASAVAPHTARVMRELLALAEPAGPILDVGTGPGLAIGGIANAFGVDASEPMLRAGGQAGVAAADVLDLPFAAGTFDVVTTNFVLPLFPKLETALFDMLRVLRPGGRLGVSVWGAEEDELSRAWRSMVEQTLGLEMFRQAVRDGMPWAEKLAQPAALETVLRDAGMRPVRTKRLRVKFEMSREDYVTGKLVDPLGRFVRHMLSQTLWARFEDRVRERYAADFPEQVGDFRDVVLAVGTKP